MNIISICAAGVVASILAVFLKKNNAEYSLILAVSGVVLIGVYILSSVVVALISVDEIFDRTNLDTKYIEVLLKCLGVCFLTEFSCDCCKDASQNALSSMVLLSGRICVLITALPLFEEFLELALSLSNGGI